MVALYLATAGAAPRVIGVFTPADQLVRAAHAHKAAVVGLSIMPSSDLPAASSAIETILPSLPPGTQLWVGGGGAARVEVKDGVRVVTTWAELDQAMRGV
jgi:methylmalonyl-CoA mutase cobalamin-binding subunit